MLLFVTHVELFIQCYMKLFHDKCQVIKYMYQVKKYLGKI